MFPLPVVFTARKGRAGLGRRRPRAEAGCWGVAAGSPRHRHHHPRGSCFPAGFWRGWRPGSITVPRAGTRGLREAEGGHQLPGHPKSRSGALLRHKAGGSRRLSPLLPPPPLPAEPPSAALAPSCSFSQALAPGILQRFQTREASKCFILSSGTEISVQAAAEQRQPSLIWAKKKKVY